MPSSVLIAAPPVDTAFFDKKTGRISAVWLSWLRSISAAGTVIENVVLQQTLNDDNSVAGNSGDMLDLALDALSLLLPAPVSATADPADGLGYAEPMRCLLPPLEPDSCIDLPPANGWVEKCAELEALIVAGDPLGYGPESFDAAGTAAALGAACLQIANNLSDLASAATARTNLAAAGLADNNTFTGTATFSGSAQTFTTPADISFGASGSNWIAWTPTVTGSGSMTAGTLSQLNCWYCRVGPIVHFRVAFKTTLGGTASIGVLATLPVAEFLGVSCPVASFSVGSEILLVAYVNGGNLVFFNQSAANFPLGATTFLASGSYQCAS